MSKLKRLCCIYCKGPVYIEKGRSVNFYTLRCEKCKHRMLIFKEDLYKLNKFEGDLSQWIK